MSEQEARELQERINASSHAINATATQYARGCWCVAYQDSITLKTFRAMSPEHWQLRCVAAQHGWLERA